MYIYIYISNIINCFFEHVHKVPCTSSAAAGCYRVLLFWPRGCFPLLGHGAAGQEYPQLPCPSEWPYEWLHGLSIKVSGLCWGVPLNGVLLIGFRLRLFWGILMVGSRFLTTTRTPTSVSAVWHPPPPPPPPPPTRPSLSLPLQLSGVGRISTISALGTKGTNSQQKVLSTQPCSRI